MDILEGSSILITGGTGSFGKAFLQQVLETRNPERVVIFSRDELKQYDMRQIWGDDPRVRFFIGDIRDRDRLRMAGAEIQEPPPNPEGFTEIVTHDPDGNRLRLFAWE